MASPTRTDAIRSAQRLESVAKRAGYHAMAARKALQVLEKRGWVTSVRLPPAGRGARPLAYTLSASRTRMMEFYRAHAWRQVRAQFEALRSW